MNLTKAHREKNLKAWKATGPGLILRPLRTLWGQQKFLYQQARHAADKGDGKTVTRMAREALKTAR